MAKPVAAIATYRALDAKGEQPSTPLLTAMTDAITRSDNCGERRVILELQQLTGGLAGAQHAFDRVLAEAGVQIAPTTNEANLSSDAVCRAYLIQRTPIANPDATIWQFGTDEWTIQQAVAFAHALANGTYGEAGSSVLSIMERPKQPALAGLEGPNGNYIPDPQWGAGQAFTRWKPAYKPGWGGSEQGNFLAGQIVVLENAVPPVALAAMFYPAKQPPSNNLGETAAPRALQALFTRVAAVLEEEHVLR